MDETTCPPVTLVGNKCDLEDDRVVSSGLGQSVAREMGPNVGFVETSAKADINVEAVKTLYLVNFNNPTHHNDPRFDLSCTTLITPPTTNTRIPFSPALAFIKS